MRVLHAPKRPPGPEDWLSTRRERGQSLSAYRAAGPVRPDGAGRVLLLQPLGPFSEAQAEVAEAVRAWIAAFTGLTVRRLPGLPLSVVPDHARRRHPTWGMEQLHTRHLLEQLLRPRRPPEALALLAYTASDLYPDPDWNFVFGQASLGARVGVWSLYRAGDPVADRRRCFARAAATAVHEVGHVLSMAHCTAWECVMNGSNGRAEADARPPWLCPTCLAKLCWNLGIDPTARFRRLRGLAEGEGLVRASAYYEAALTLLRGRAPLPRPSL